MAQPYYGFTTTTTLDDTALMLCRNLGENKNISFSAFKSLLFTGPTITGNLNFTGTGNRITGDFSNATLANRVMFQTSTVNGVTGVMLAPNGTATVSTIMAINNSNPTNAGFGAIRSTTTVNAFQSSINGSGTLLPLSLRMSTTDHLLLSTNGNLVVKTAAAQSDDDSSAKLQVTGGVKSDKYKLSALNTAPSSATDTGTLGEIRVTATHIYVCTATNTWVRSALSSW